jgi:hypothetical protein
MERKMNVSLEPNTRLGSLCHSEAVSMCMTRQVASHEEPMGRHLLGPRKNTFK